MRRTWTRVLLGVTAAALVGSTVGLQGPAGADPGDVTTFDAEGLGNMQGITTGPDGNVWFTSPGVDEGDPEDDRIGRITPTGTVTLFDHADLAMPTGITAGPDGNVWFTIFSAHKVGRITPAGVITTFDVLAEGIQLPSSIATGPDGNLWITGFNNGTIGRVTPTGVVTDFTDPDLQGPTEITAGPDGNLWFADQFGSQLGRITVAGAITLYPHPDERQPSDIVAGADGNLWFTTLQGVIGRSTTAGAITSFPTSAANNAEDLALGPDGDLWYTRSGGIGRLRDDGTADILATDPLNFPTNITAGPDDDLCGTHFYQHFETPGDPLARFEPPVAPSAPSALQATPSPGQVALSWTAPDDGGAPITGYVVYRDGVAVKTVTGTSTSVTGLTNGTEYDFQIAAVTDYAEGPKSTVASATPTTNTLTFSDVPPTHPFASDIGWMAAQGISTGYSDGTYKPAAPVTRAAMSAFMYRLAGSPDFEDPDGFTFWDVQPTHPFFSEIEWMAAEGITTGTPGFPTPSYKPAAAVSRGAMSAFMYRLAGSPAFVDPPSPTFGDVDGSHPFFSEIEWMADEDITTGTPASPKPLYRPGAAVSRAAMSAFMHRLADGPGVDL